MQHSLLLNFLHVFFSYHSPFLIFEIEFKVFISHSSSKPLNLASGIFSPSLQVNNFLAIPLLNLSFSSINLIVFSKYSSIFESADAMRFCSSNGGIGIFIFLNFFFQRIQTALFCFQEVLFSQTACL